MTEPSIEAAMELLGIPSEYLDETVAEFTQQWGGIDRAACEKALHAGGEDDEFSRAFALFVIASSGASDVSQLLVRYSHDSSLLVRMASLVSLGYLGVSDSLPELHEILANPPKFDAKAPEDEQIINGMIEGLVWGCVPEILGDFGNQGSLPTLAHVLSTELQTIPAGQILNHPRAQMLLYTSGRLQGWTLLPKAQTTTSEAQQLALLMVLGSLHERMVIERDRHRTGAPIPIPANMFPNQRLGAVIVQLLVQHCGVTHEQAHSITEGSASDAYVISDRLLNSVEAHKRMFHPFQNATMNGRLA